MTIGQRPNFCMWEMMLLAMGLGKCTRVCL
uniref:Uncharacterized protein n=1 Tax=Anguilla anguilla TaxID=7936 RepID=A0A0E9SH81_ANGAN